MTPPILGGHFGYFLFFSARGRGRGEYGATGRGGVGFLLKIPRRGGASPGGEGGGEGAGRVSAGNFGGGGAKSFSSGPKFPPSI